MTFAASSVLGDALLEQAQGSVSMSSPHAMLLFSGLTSF
jgi:hypothetical protein